MWWRIRLRQTGCTGRPSVLARVLCFRCQEPRPAKVRCRRETDGSGGRRRRPRQVIPWRSERTATMVPGMTERERLIADMQRLEWLCDAVIGPARSSGRRPPRTGSPAEAPWMLVLRELRWRGLAETNQITSIEIRSCHAGSARTRKAVTECCESFSWWWRGSLAICVYD